MRPRARLTAQSTLDPGPPQPRLLVLALVPTLPDAAQPPEDGQQARRAAYLLRAAEEAYAALLEAEMDPIAAAESAAIQAKDGMLGLVAGRRVRRGARRSAQGPTAPPASRLQRL